MKICWDSLAKIKFTKRRTFRSLDGKREYIEKESCKYCKDPYLTEVRSNSDYCCHPCSRIDKPRPLEIRNKISISLTGKFVGETNPFYGKKHSNKTKVKWIECKRHMREKNHNWKGGISIEPYCDIWKDKEYKGDIKERDGNKCINPYCVSGSDVLVLHHIDYDKNNCHPSNLVTVCNSCNCKANYDREWHKTWYQSILYRRYGYEYK
jgi:hypothetical protein